MKILGKTIVELGKLIKEKEVSGKELFEYFKNRIKKYNTKLNALITETEFNEQRGNSLAGGIPFVAKDNYCTKGVRTTASSKVLENFIPPYESTVTDKLKKDGAILMGKTNMDAWAHGSSTETSDFGPTRNPWDLSRSPGGSSGGSTSAVSSYLSPFAIGSETAGSIRQPSAWCGVVGLKPTYGRVSRYGVIAMGSSFDCPGPITLSVEDAALILSLIAGQDKYDATSSPVSVTDYHKALSLQKKFTIGISEKYFEGLEASLKVKILEALDIFKKMGHNIKKIKLIHPKYAISVYTILQRAEVSSNLSRYDGIRFGNNRTYLMEEAKRRIMLGAYTLSYGYYDAYYKKAQKMRTLIIQDLKRVLEEVDLIVASSTPVTALKLGEYEKYPFFGETMDVLDEAAAVAGIPAISIPVGFDKNNLPVGMQIMGNYFSEQSILDLAYQFEKETDFFGVIKKGIERYND